MNTIIWSLTTVRNTQYGLAIHRSLASALSREGGLCSTRSLWPHINISWYHTKSSTLFSPNTLSIPRCNCLSLDHFLLDVFVRSSPYCFVLATHVYVGSSTRGRVRLCWRLMTQHSVFYFSVQCSSPCMSLRDLVSCFDFIIIFQSGYGVVCTFIWRYARHSKQDPWWLKLPVSMALISICSYLITFYIDYDGTRFFQHGTNINYAVNIKILIHVTGRYAPWLLLWLFAPFTAI